MLQWWKTANQPSTRPSVRKHARLVRAWKFTLPVLALLVVGTLVFIGQFQPVQPGFRIDFAAIKKDEGAETRMVNPRIQGVDKRNQPYFINADSAVQTDVDHVLLSNLNADIALQGGSWMALKAKKGNLDIKNNDINFYGGVYIYSDSGYEFTAPEVLVDAENMVAYGDSGIEGKSFLGNLKGNGFILYSNEKIIQFHGGVKVTVFP